MRMAGQSVSLQRIVAISRAQLTRQVCPSNLGDHSVLKPLRLFTHDRQGVEPGGQSRLVVACALTVGNVMTLPNVISLHNAGSQSLKSFL